MSNTLRDELIRLAHAKPELREHLLPLIRKHADLATTMAVTKAVRGLIRSLKKKINLTEGAEDPKQFEHSLEYNLVQAFNKTVKQYKP